MLLHQRLHPHDLIRRRFSSAQDVHGCAARDAANDLSVWAVAQAAYDERRKKRLELDPVRLAVLADALEEAGCTETILAHLREDSPHVRGCWVLDLILGKE